MDVMSPPSLPSKNSKPKVLLANTRKGMGIRQLEDDPLCHVKSLKPDEIDDILESCG